MLNVFKMRQTKLTCTLAAGVMLAIAVAACANPSAIATQAAAPSTTPAASVQPKPPSAPAAVVQAAQPAARPSAVVAVSDPRDLVPPSPIRFEDAVARASTRLFADARASLGEQ